jgi:DNA-binding winged helix-turn-helix (wHTH) protein
MVQQSTTQSVQHFGSLVIDRVIREVTVDGLVIHLTNAEYTLLATLAEHPRRAFGSDHLMRILTSSEWGGDTHALQSHVSRLRAKLGESGVQPRQVVTVHGYGYRFVPEPTPTLSSAVTTETNGDKPFGQHAGVYMLLNVDTTIVWASSSVRDLIGWQSSDVEGSALYDLLDPDDLFAVVAARAELNAGYPTALMVRMRTINQEHRDVEVLTRPIIGCEGRVALLLTEIRPAPPDWSAPGSVPSAIRLGRHVKTGVDAESPPPVR